MIHGQRGLSSGYGRRLMFKRSCVRIPAQDTFKKDRNELNRGEKLPIFKVVLHYTQNTTA